MGEGISCLSPNGPHNNNTASATSIFGADNSVSNQSSTLFFFLILFLIFLFENFCRKYMFESTLPQFQFENRFKFMFEPRFPQFLFEILVPSTHQTILLISPPNRYVANISTITIFSSNDNQCCVESKSTNTKRYMIDIF